MNHTHNGQKAVAYSFLGSLAVFFLTKALFLSRVGRIGTIYVDGDGKCVSLNSYIETSPEIKQAVYPYLQMPRDQFISNCYDWLTRNISYPHNGAEVWYTPSEVAQRKVSGCFGSSCLLVSMLRQRLSQAEVYVAIGKLAGEGHAWCEAKLNGGWHILEATRPMYYLTNGHYDTILLFNDMETLGSRDSRAFLEEYLCKGS